MKKKIAVVGLVVLIVTIIGLVIFIKNTEVDEQIPERLVEIKEAEELDSINSTDIIYDEVFEVECPDEGQ